jgi:hypothetical protein
MYEKDPLGHDTYARTLWTRIQAALNKDQNSQPLGDDPLVVGIFGEWGAGKSHLLGLIKKMADQQLEVQRKQRLIDEGFSLTVPVFFQPWKYEHEEHLHVPLLMHVFEAFKEAVKRAQTPSEHWLQSLENMWHKIAPHLPAGVKLFEKLLVDSVGVSISADQAKWGLKTLNWLSKRSNRSTRHSSLADQYKFSGDGHYYRHIQEALKAVTRPSLHPEMLQGLKLICNPAINFVIFIDDLDRCLPEKAVQTLELIKTVFNVESFAFVLALDSEVIERGIGHRYREYKLQDKKPEMPITGFEYLEKIVHLPFSLPAISKAEAQQLIRQQEIKVRNALGISSEMPLWFTPFTEENPVQALLVNQQDPAEREYQRHWNELNAGQGMVAQALPSKHALGWVTLDLCDLALSAFTHYVPRKLLRLVELFYAVAKLAHQRELDQASGGSYGITNDKSKRALTSTLGGEIDVRIVLSLVLLQLFQPELFRVIRRTQYGFPTLLSAFARGELYDKSADVQLLSWVVFRDQNATTAYPTSLKSVSLQMGQVNPAELHEAQQVRFPLVQCLIDHRLVQRHAFDPMRLFHHLARLGSMAAYNAPETQHPVGELSLLSMQRYFGLLARHWPNQISLLPPALNVTPTAVLEDVKQVPLQDDTVPFDLAKSMVKPVDTYKIPNVEALFEQMIRPNAGEASIKEALGPIAFGQHLDNASSRQLVQLIERYMLQQGALNAEKPTGLLKAYGLILRSLSVIAAHLTPAVWAPLSSGASVILPGPSKPNALTSAPELASLYLDMRSMLGQERRFAGEYAFFVEEETSTPTASDVQVVATFYSADGTESQTVHGTRVQPPTDLLKHFSGLIANEGHLFAFARTLTTVQQYKAFMDDGGYNPQAEWWSADGEDWLSGNRQSDVEAMWLNQRKDDLRFKPWDWAEQLRIPHRPVHGITFFEAEAYANWLNIRLGPQLLQTVQAKRPSATIRDCVVRLPTVEEWKRAATLGGWLGREQSDQHANLNDKIKSPSVPGCFAPDQLGLYDMLGNLWEMQSPIKKTKDDKDIIDVCGGTWRAPSFIAQGFDQCVSNGIPSAHLNIVGFRVGLSVHIDNTP